MAHSGVYSRYGKEKPVSDSVMTVKDACKILKCGKTNIYNLINCGKLSAVKVGEKKGIRIYERDVDRLLNEIDA